MNAKIEPKRLQTILNAAMIDGEIDPFAIKTNDKGLIALNVTASSNLASVIVAKAGYFLEFEATGKEEFTFGKEVVERLKWGFKKDELNVKADENKMVISDGTDKLPVELDEKLERVFPIPITNTKYGRIADYNLYNILKTEKEKPEEWTDDDALKGYNIYKTEADNLKFPGNVTNYKLVLKDGKISVSIGGTSTSFVHKVEGKSIQGKDMHIVVSAELFKKIVNNLDGEIYIIYNENSVTFTQIHQTNLSKTFCLATKEEE